MNFPVFLFSQSLLIFVRACAFAQLFFLLLPSHSDNFFSYQNKFNSAELLVFLRSTISKNIFLIFLLFISLVGDTAEVNEIEKICFLRIKLILSINLSGKLEKFIEIFVFTFAHKFKI